MAAGGGGAWKVAYADFVTAMMAFFLVMWITAQSNAVKQSIAKYFEHPYDASSRSPIPSKSSSGSSLLPMNRAMDGSPPHSTSKGKSTRGGGFATDDQPPADPSTVPKSGGLRKRSGFMLREVDQSGVGTVVVFSGESTDLDDRAKQALNEIVPALLGKMNKLEIRGHASSRPENSTASANDAAPEIWQHSYARCRAVMQFLEQHGIESKRIRLSQAGAFEPPSENDAPDWQSPQARVEVYLLPEYVDDYLGTNRRDEAKAGASASSGATAAASENHQTTPPTAVHVPHDAS